jgi:hypothetical protein
MVDSVQQSVAVQTLMCWLDCFVHNGPLSPKFQIVPSQLRQTEDRAAGLRIKSLDTVLTQKAKYVGSWPNTTSAWAGWSRFDIPGDRYGGVHSLLGCTGVSYLPLG